MKVVRLQQPKKIEFGPGCAIQCADDLRGLGIGRFLIITAPPIVGLVEPLADALAKDGALVTIHAEIATEPTIAMFEDALEAARRAEPEAVLGFGGGSAMDVAKLVAALYDGEQSVREVFGIDRVASRPLHLICLPTTAGTGSEVSPNAILLDETEDLKKGVISPHLVPDAAYVDPELTLTVPPKVTASTGLDALTHCIEVYANRFAHPIPDLYALEGVRLIAASVVQAVEQAEDLEARTQMMLGSLYGGLGLAPVNTAAVHALAYPLGGEFHVAHGVSNAVLLPHVLRFNLSAAPERYAEVALALGVEAGDSVLETAQHGLDRLVELSGLCGIPMGMSELGVPAEAIPRMVEAAMGVTRLLRNNLREVTAADAEAIYRAAY